MIVEVTANQMLNDDQLAGEMQSVTLNEVASNHVATEPCDGNSSGCCNVYVANLPPSADATKIRELFATEGKVLHVKVLLDIATGVSRGIAFVMFEDIITARKACALKNKTVLDGSVLQVRLAERSALHSSPDAHVRSNVVYIRNVPGKVTRAEVKLFCESKYGPVDDVVPHPQSCEQNGPSPYNMLFVTFKNVDDACLCVEGVDGKVPFPLPNSSHPFTMAKMINDVAGEMRKSILLRRRRSDPPSASGSPSQMDLAPPQTYRIQNHGSPSQIGLSPPQLSHHTTVMHPQMMYQSQASFVPNLTNPNGGSVQPFTVSPQVIPLMPQMGTPPQSPGNVCLAPQHSIGQVRSFNQQMYSPSPTSYALVPGVGFVGNQQLVAQTFSLDSQRREAPSGIEQGTNAGMSVYSTPPYIAHSFPPPGQVMQNHYQMQNNQSTLSHCQQIPSQQVVFVSLPQGHQPQYFVQQ